MKDEDYAYENARQDRIDNGKWHNMSGDMIGSARLPQKFDRYDPWPSIPFAVEQEVPSKWQAVAYVLFATMLMWMLL